MRKGNDRMLFAYVTCIRKAAKKDRHILSWA